MAQENNLTHYSHNIRMELLRKWINTAGVGATYENLVKDLLDIGESRAARAIAQLWNCTYTL